MRFTYTAEVAASAQTVFMCVDDPEKIIRWVSGAVEHHYITERFGGTAVGQRFRQILRQGSKLRTFYGEIIAWEEPTHFALRIPDLAYSSEAHFHISPTARGQSVVTYRLDVALHSWAARIIGPLLKPLIFWFVRYQIRRLKAFAESLPILYVKRLGPVGQKVGA